MSFRMRKLRIHVVTGIKKIVRQICAGACVEIRKHQFLRKYGGIEIYLRLPKKVLSILIGIMD